MATVHTFTRSRDIQVVVGSEDALGDGGLIGSGTYYRLPITAPPTIIDNNLPLESTGQLSGTYFQGHRESNQRADNQMWEIQLQMYLVTDVFKYLFNTSDGNTQYLSADYTPPTWTNGVAGSTTTNPSATIYIVNGTVESGKTYTKYAGCVCKSIEVQHSLDSNGGMATMNVTFVTGYKAKTNTDTISVTGKTETTQTNYQDILVGKALVGKWLGETSGSSDYDVIPYSHSLSVSREIARVGYVDTTDYEPRNYLQVGGWDISGSVTFKKDSNFTNIQAYFRDNKLGGFAIPYDANYYMKMHGMVSDVSNDTGSSDLRATVTFKGLANHLLTSTIASFSNYHSTVSGTTKAVSSNHGLKTGQKITISGCAEGGYNTDFIITVIDDDSFYFTFSYVAETIGGTEKWDLHNDSKQIIQIKNDQ